MAGKWLLPIQPVLGEIIMVKVNPDPLEKGYQFSPLHHVRGIFASSDAIERAVQSLEEAGFRDDEIQVFIGDHGVDQLDTAGRRHNVIIRVLRDLDDIFWAQDSEIHEKANRVLRGGGAVVDVHTHGESEKKQRAGEALKSSGAKDVVYWGHLQVEYL
jgi:hypothetical protein